MVRFQTTTDDPESRGSTRTPPPNYFSRAQQYRLLTLVFTLMLVLFLMGEAAKPKNWQWMWRIAGGESTAAKPHESQSAGGSAGGNGETVQAVPWNEASTGEQGSVEESDVDTRLPDRSTHPPGVFVSQSSGARPNEEIVTDSNRLFSGINGAELEPIRDDTVFRSAESDTWFRWCEIVRDSDALKSSDDVQSVTFLQLFRQPDEYRGRAVRVSGIVRRAHQVPARSNEKGIEGYHRCWLFPANGANNPIVVYSLRMPDGFPTGMELHEEASFTGVFFKRWAYQAQGGIMTAPLVLSADADWSPVVPPPPIRTPALPWIVTAIGGAALIGAAVAWMAYQQSSAQSAHVRRSRERDFPDQAPVISKEVIPKDVDKSPSLSIYEQNEAPRE